MNRERLAILIAATVALAVAVTLTIDSTRSGLTYLLGCGIGVTVSAIVHELKS